MYYDRSLRKELLALASANGPLAWLLRWVEAEAATRLAFRRANGARNHGAVQVYVGRTSPLEFLWRTKGAVVLSADAKYRKVSPALFSQQHPVASLAALEPRLRQHLDDCRSSMPEAFTKGEAVVHNRMMRRYSLHHRKDDPVVAVDCEVKVGFDSKKQRQAYVDAATRDPGRSHPDSPLRKLDAIGILREGEVALIEVKKEGGGLATAARQVEDHVFNFTRLLDERHDLAGMLDCMVEQKQGLGWVSDGASSAPTSPLLVPIVAAPDHQADWVSRWSSKIAPVANASDYLGDLRFWRLSNDGEVVEEYRL